MRWDWLSSRALRESGKRVAFLPAGTLEAHGDGPLGTDNFIPEAVALELAEEHGAIVLPTLPYGVTSTLLAYPGSLTVGPATLEQLVVELGGGLSGAKISRLVIFNGHGGNNEPLRRAAKRIFSETGVHAAVVEPWTLWEDAAKEHLKEGLGHAGADELGFLWAVRPDVAGLDYGSVRSWRVRRGVYANPAPAATLTYNGTGVSFDNLSHDEIKRFAKDAMRSVSEVVGALLAGWEELDRLRAGE